MSDVEEQVEKINARMFRNRLSQELTDYKGWHCEMDRHFRPKKPRDFIRQHLAMGHRVTAGYFATAVRGYHDYVVFWKERANAR